MNIYLNKLRQDKYTNSILNHILNNKLYDQAWLCKDAPDDILIKAGIDIYKKNFCYIRHDIGADIVVIKDNITYFIKCKYIKNPLTYEDMGDFLFLIYGYNLNSIVYYNTQLGDLIKAISTGRIKYIHYLDE